MEGQGPLHRSAPSALSLDDSHPGLLLPGVFIRYDPLTSAAPLLVDVSRSGREYPPEYRSPLPFSVAHDNVSMYVEELWSAAPALGATLLYCCFPNTFVDVNRREDDVDPSALADPEARSVHPSPVAMRGLGLIKTKSRYGEPFQEHKLTDTELDDRLDRYYRPYHRELARLVIDLRSRFGVLRHLSCHCMSAVGAPTHGDAGKPRPDFCIGDVNGVSSSRAFVDFVAGELRGYGYSVNVNDPYAGDELNRRYGAPAKGIDSIMIEINKKLFMDTATFRKTAGFAKLKSDVDRLLSAIVADARSAVTGQKA